MTFVFTYKRLTLEIRNEFENSCQKSDNVNVFTLRIESAGGGPKSHLSGPRHVQMSFTLVVRVSGNRGAAHALAWFSSGLSEGRHTVTSDCRSPESRPHGVTNAMPSGHLSGPPRASCRCGRCRRGAAGATTPRAHTPKSPVSFPKQPLGPMCPRQG